MTGDDPKVLRAKDRLRAIGAVIDMSGGNCPVQIEGTFRGHPFHFRARGSRWRVWAGPGATALRESSLHEVREYRPDGIGDEEARFAAGWMDEDEALDLLRESLERMAGIRP